MTMIEKMAKAMIVAVSPDRDFTTNPYYEVERNYWERVIRAGLGAMLEPSEAMVDGARFAGEAGDFKQSVVDAIQAALDEKEG